MSHRIDIIIGLVNTALGVAGLGLAVFGPATYSYGTNWLTAASTSLWDQGLDTAVVIYLAVMLLAALAVSAGAYLRSYRSGIEGAALLWVSTIVLLVGAAITIPGSTTAIVPSDLHTDTPDSVGIGIYFVPAALVALVAAIVTMAVHHTPGRPMAMRPH
jgi:hypothetical protein